MKSRKDIWGMRRRGRKREREGGREGDKVRGETLLFETIAFSTGFVMAREECQDSDRKSE